MKLLTKNYGKKTGQEPVLDQIRKRKWNCVRNTLRRNDLSITKQVQQWTPQDHRGRRQPRNTWRRDLEKEMWTAGYKYCWRKMEAAAQDRAGWRQVVCDLCSTGSDKKVSRKSSHITQQWHLCTKFGERAFSFSGPSARNALHTDIQDETCTAIFKRKLKTFYFSQGLTAYDFIVF